MQCTNTLETFIKQFVHKKLAFDDLELNSLDLSPHFGQQFLLPCLQISVGSSTAGISETDRLLTSQRLETSTETHYCCQLLKQPKKTSFVYTVFSTENVTVYIQQ